MIGYHTWDYIHFSALRNTAHETQADRIMLRLIGLHVKSAGRLSSFEGSCCSSDSKDDVTGGQRKRAGLLLL